MCLKECMIWPANFFLKTVTYKMTASLSLQLVEICLRCHFGIMRVYTVLTFVGA